MFETTSDQQTQSSVIVVSSNNTVGSVVSSSNVDGAINALNDAIVDAIDHQSHLNHHHSHINTIISSYFNCKNLIEFPQFHHHHHHVHTYNLNLNLNNFHNTTPTSSSTSTSNNQASIFTGVAESQALINSSITKTKASILSEQSLFSTSSTLPTLINSTNNCDSINNKKDLKSNTTEEIDKINTNLSSLNPFSSLLSTSDTPTLKLIPSLLTCSNEKLLSNAINAIDDEGELASNTFSYKSNLSQLIQNDLEVDTNQKLMELEKENSINTNNNSLSDSRPPFHSTNKKTESNVTNTDEKSIEIDNNNNTICQEENRIDEPIDDDIHISNSSKEEIMILDTTSSHLKLETNNIKDLSTAANKLTKSSLSKISTNVKNKILMQFKKIPKRLGLRKRRKTTVLYDSNNSNNTSSINKAVLHGGANLHRVLLLVFLKKVIIRQLNINVQKAKTQKYQLL